MKQATGNREQGTEKRGARERGSEGAEPLVGLLRSALTPVGEGGEAARDLWPAMRRRLDEPATLRGVPWFDWALAGSVAVFAVAFPTAVPMLLYYL